MKKIEQAVDILKAGGVVGIPTETVYGLAASIESETGLKKIFSTKERPFFDPLIVHIASIEQAKIYTKNWCDTCQLLAKNFWPGPLTLILPKNELINPLITSGLETVGVRMPRHPLALQLIEQLGHPIAAPSANKFKATSPTSAKHVTDIFDSLYVIDGGECEVGIESSILEVSNNSVKIYRPGMITIEDIQTLLKENGINKEVILSSSPVAPGQLKHHYMPKIPLILCHDFDEPTKRQIETKLLTNPKIFKLDMDASIAARIIYQKLRDFDHHHSSIVIEFAKENITKPAWQGILNRLEKAASCNLTK